MVALKGACRNYDALWYCLARCRDVGSDYNIFFFLFLFLTRHHPAWSLGIQCVHACAQCQYAKQLESHARSKG